MTPSINSLVHYVARGSKDGIFPATCRAAVVTEVGDTQVGIMVMNPTGLFFHSLADGGVDYDPNMAGGTWHWAEQVE